MPVLSICIPTYNRCEYLMNNLQHICEHQEYDFEIIISDNASTDDTYKRVTEYIKNNNIDKIKYFRNRENIGPDANFKRVLSLGQGKYSLLLGDDDYLNDDFFEKVLPFLKKNEFSFVALSSKEMMKKSEGKEYCSFGISDMDKFLLLLGPHITFMSIMIFNSEILHKVLENNINYETNLYQSFLAINVIHKNEKMRYSVYFYNPFSFNGDTSAANYDFYTVFVNGIIALYKIALPNLSNKEILKIYSRSFGYFIFKFTLILKAIGVKQKINKSHYNNLKNSLWFWLATFPCYITPSVLLSGLYKLYRLRKRK